MPTKTEVGLSCKRIRTFNDFVDVSPYIRALVKTYLDNVDDKYTIDEIMNIMSVAVEQHDFFIYYAERDNVGVGLMTAHSITSDSKRSGMIHIGVIESSVTREESKEMLELAMDSLKDWAVDNAFETVYAQSRREKDAFMKLLSKHGWKIDTIVYGLEVNYGKSEEDNA